MFRFWADDDVGKGWRANANITHDLTRDTATTTAAATTHKNACVMYFHPVTTCTYVMRHIPIHNIYHRYATQAHTSPFNTHTRTQCVIVALRAKYPTPLSPHPLGGRGVRGRCTVACRLAMSAMYGWVDPLGKLPLFCVRTDGVPQNAKPTQHVWV